MGLDSYLFGRITPVTADGAHLVRPGKPDKIDVDLHYWRSAWPMRELFFIGLVFR